MALWPDQDNELKAPERSNSDDNQTIEPLKSKSEPPEDKKLVTDPLEEDSQSETKKKDVHSLDDGQLKALLDEAIQYKNPKDREGKSKIFRDLLKKVEDEIGCNSPIVGIRRKIGRNTYNAREGSKINTVSERASRGGSLQNIFHAASSAEFETHHTSGTRKKSKRQSPGSSVSSRQREGGSLPSNVNAGWPLESWQSDQVRKKGLFDRDSQQQNHMSIGLGNTASCVSSSVASSSTQARRQTLMHSASNELPSSRKQNSGELYPLRRHHSSSDQSKSTEVATTKLKVQSEGSSMVKKMPQVAEPAEYVAVDMNFSLEMNPVGDTDPALCFDKRFPINVNKKFRITPSGVESENENNNSSEVYTSRASLEVEPADTVIDFDIVSKVNFGLELNEKYPSVQCIVGGESKLSERTNQGRISDQGGLRSHKYRNSISLVHISPKSTIKSSRTDENGNALTLSGLSTRSSTQKKNHKRKQLAEKNVVLSVSDNIAGYRGRDRLEDLLNFIESDDYNKNKNLKKTLTKGKKHEKKRKNIQESGSLEEISQRNIEDLTESSESQRNGRKPGKGANTEETGLRDRRSWGEQVYVRSESQNNLATEQMDDNNSDSDFQMVTKKQRKRKVNDPNAKRIRNHRSMKRSPRRKSTSSVPPSERSGDSDLDSIHSLPVGGAPITSYADIAAGNTTFFNSKGIREISTFNKKEASQRKSASAKNNEIQEWCKSVSQHMENDVKIINNNNNSNNNISNINKNNSPNNHINNNNDSNYIYNINNINNNANNSISYLKNFSKQDDRKQQNLDVDQNGICDTNVRKLKDLVIVDNSIVNSEVTKNHKVVEPSLKSEFKKVASNCDVNQCKNVDNKNIEVKKNWNKKNFSREEIPSLPVKSENSNCQKTKELSEPSGLAKTKQYSSLSDTDKQEEDKSDATKTDQKIKSDDDVKHRRANRSKSVGPNTRPAVILLHDERTKDAGVCEITFGFEVNEQLLTSDDSGQVLEEESEPIIASKMFDKTGSNSVIKNHERVRDENRNNSNGEIIYSDVIENRKTFKNAKTGGTFGEITNSTVQELFKRHEMTSRLIAPHSNPYTADSATSIAKYVPPITPIDFNHDKIVTFVGTAWEDVMRNGKIQYYSGEE